MKKLCLAILLVGLTTAAIAAPPFPVPNQGQTGPQGLGFQTGPQGLGLQKPGGFHRLAPGSNLNMKRNMKLDRVKMINNKRLS